MGVSVIVRVRVRVGMRGSEVGRIRLLPPSSSYLFAEGIRDIRPRLQRCSLLRLGFGPLVRAIPDSSAAAFERQCSQVLNVVLAVILAVTLAALLARLVPVNIAIINIAIITIHRADYTQLEYRSYIGD